MAIDLDYFVSESHFIFCAHISLIHYEILQLIIVNCNVKSIFVNPCGHYFQVNYYY